MGASKSGSGCTGEACLPHAPPSSTSLLSRLLSPLVHSHIHSFIHSMNIYLAPFINTKDTAVSQSLPLWRLRYLYSTTSSHFTECLLLCLVIAGPTGKRDFWWHFSTKTKGEIFGIKHTHKKNLTFLKLYRIGNWFFTYDITCTVRVSRLY